MERETTTVAGQLGKILSNRKIMWRTIFVLLAITALLPFTLPIRVSNPVRQVKTKIDSLTPSNKVIFVIDFFAADVAECVPLAKSIAEHLIQKGVRVVFVGFTNPDVVVLGNSMLNDLNIYNRRKYGTDFVWLGLIPGGEITISTLATDWSIISKDVFGRPKTELPLLRDINKITDFDLVVVISTQDPQPYASLRHWVQRFDMYAVGGSSSHGAPAYYRFYEMGVLKGIVIGLRGTVEYESLSGVVGIASRRMNVVSISQLAVAIVLLIAIISHSIDSVSKRRRK